MFMEKRVNKYISLLFGLLVATSGCTDEFETENLRNDILLPGEYTVSGTQIRAHETKANLVWPGSGEKK